LAQVVQGVQVLLQLAQQVQIRCSQLLLQLAAVAVVHEIRQKLVVVVVLVVAVQVTAALLARQAQAVKVRLVEQEMFLIVLAQVAVVLVPLE
jgi:hypothetical protein